MPVDYGKLARPLTANPPADPIYADWIAMFGNDAYDGLVAETTALFDRLVDPGDRTNRGALTEFERSTRYEAEFWDMAYGKPRPAGLPDEGGTP